MIAGIARLAATVALYPTTAMISFAVQYLAPDLDSDPAVKKYLDRLDALA